MEHLPHPLDTLERVARSLKTGGTLFVSVPSVDHLPVHHDFRYCLNGRTHIVAFTAACLKTLMERAGLSGIEPVDDQELDILTGGVPTRLRMLARRHQGTVCHQSEVSPLAAALRALLAADVLDETDASTVSRLVNKQAQ
jgi:hypothetical protein